MKTRLSPSGEKAGKLSAEDSGGEVSLFRGSLTAVPGTTTRVAVIERGDGQHPDVLMEIVGSPCDGLLATVHVIPTTDS